MKKTKDQVQAEALKAIEENNGRGIFIGATGVGKSKVPIDFMRKHLSLSANILLVVPTEKLRDVNWQKEFSKWGASDYYDVMQRECYASIHKMSGKSYDLVIFDEIHNITELNSSFFHQNKLNTVIGLTATMPSDHIKIALLRKLELLPVYTVTMDEAVTWGLVSPYEVTIVEVPLDSMRKNVKAGSKNKPFYQTELQAYEWLNKQTQMLINMEFKSPADRKKTEMFIFKRMRFIYDLNSKTETAEYILRNVLPHEERTLIFAGSIAQADKLHFHSYHSKSKNSESFDLFSNEEINRLACVNSLNEGHNLPNVDNALVVQLNSKKLNLIQRIGRVVRYRDGHTGKIIILVAKNTVDEIWVSKAIADFDQTKIQRLSFVEFKKLYL